MCIGRHLSDRFIGIWSCRTNICLDIIFWLSLTYVDQANVLLPILKLFHLFFLVTIFMSCAPTKSKLLPSLLFAKPRQTLFLLYVATSKLWMAAESSSAGIAWLGLAALTEVVAGDPEGTNGDMDFCYFAYHFNSCYHMKLPFKGMFEF